MNSQLLTSEQGDDRQQVACRGGGDGDGEKDDDDPAKGGWQCCSLVSRVKCRNLLRPSI